MSTVGSSVSRTQRDSPTQTALVSQLRVPVAVAVLGWAAARTGMSLLAVLAIAVLVTFVVASWDRFTQQMTGTGTDTTRREGSVPQLRLELTALTEELEDARRRVRASASGLTVAADVAVRMEENVRAVIVADLHDTVTQSLVAASYATYDPDISRERLTELMTEAERELRTVMLDQSPLRDETATLADHLVSLVARMNQRHQLEVEVSWPDRPAELLYPEALVIYRFIHEALTNVAKHAGVDTARVSLDCRPDGTTVTVTDTGAGFDAGNPVVENRLGLGLLRKRCAIVGGRVSVSSTPGRGTTLTLHLPPMAIPD